jgi:hypothetical protein
MEASVFEQKCNLVSYSTLFITCFQIPSFLEKRASHIRLLVMICIVNSGKL